MDHAILALGIAALPAVVLPLRGVQELLKRGRVALLEQIARPLPAKDGVQGIAPGRALEVLLAHQELQEQRRLVELPRLGLVGQHVAEELSGPLASQKMLLVGRLGVAVARRYHHPLHTQLHHLVEEASHPKRLGVVEERGVGRHAVPAADGVLDGRGSFGVHAVAADGLVVVLLQPVHVHAEGEVARRLEGALGQTLPEQEGVGAEIDKLFSLDQPLHQLADEGIHQRLAAGDADHGRAALVRGRQALLDGEVFLQDLRGVLDLAAAGAGEVASHQRLQHHHQGIPLPPQEFIRHHVARHGPRLRCRYGHGLCVLFQGPSRPSPGRPKPSF